MADVPGRGIVRPFQAGMSRRDLLRRSALFAVAGTMGSSFLSACGGDDGGGGGGGGADRPLTPSYYAWILSLYPMIREVSKEFPEPVEVQQAPTQGFDVARFVAEAREGESSWDVYVGQTPFVEMASLVEADVTEPWDDYVSQDVLDSIVPSVREESTYNGKFYNFPFVTDIVVSAWHAGLVEKAGLDPDEVPETWDDILTSAQQVVDSGAAPYGITFDAHGWRSLAPIAHSFDTDVYREDGLFDFTHDAVVEALVVMKKMKELANPNVLDPGTTDGGVNDTPDEGAFASEQVAYYIKYANAPVRFAEGWQNPEALTFGPLQAPPGGAAGTVFWTTGAALFKHGYNKKAAAEYMHHVATDEQIWRHSLGKEGQGVGNLPSYSSIWSEWENQRPEWLVDWANLVGGQLERARAIVTTQFGVQQFNLGQPHWETYLTGKESDPRKALQAAMDAVLAEVERQG
jgi:multiple sugar transport system substrate-binding protein